MKRTKTPKASETIVTEVVFPNDANPMGFLQGGRLVQWMDIASAVCAQSHAERICVTASIDSMKFKQPAKIGDIITIKAKVTRAFNTSMEIYVEAWAKKILGQKAYLINEAYFTFVALDNNAQATHVPPIKPVTKEEIAAFKLSGKRRATRIKNNQ